jgi:hypothetical protein
MDGMGIYGLLEAADLNVKLERGYLHVSCEYLAYKTLNYVQIDGVGHYARTGVGVKSQVVYNHHLDLGHF